MKSRAPCLLVGQATLQAFEPGERPIGVQFDLYIRDLGSIGFTAVVDDDGTGTGSLTECLEDNNDAVWLNPCP